MKLRAGSKINLKNPLTANWKEIVSQVSCDVTMGRPVNIYRNLTFFPKKETLRSSRNSVTI